MDSADSSLPPPIQSPAPVPQQERNPGTEALYHAACNILKSLLILTQVARPQKEVFELHTQAKLFEEVCHDLEEEALRQRRDPKGSLALSTADQFHLHRLWDSISIVGERCYTGSVSPLQDRLRKIVEPYPDPSEFEKRLRLPLQELDWYGRTAQVLKNQTDTLKVLRTAIGLAYYKNDVNYGGDLSSATHEAAATLQSLISTLKLDLDRASRYEALSILVRFVLERATHHDLGRVSPRPIFLTLAGDAVSNANLLASEGEAGALYQEGLPPYSQVPC